MRIAISSGHGKYVPGAVGIINEVDEARKVVNQMAALWRVEGVFADVFHENSARNRRDNVNAIVSHHNAQQRDLDISVHFNAFKPTDAPRGVEVLYNTERLLAAKVSAAIAKAAKLRDRGAKNRKDLSFLNDTNRSAILIEVCFVDSGADVAQYHLCFDQICDAICKAVVKPRDDTQEDPIKSMQALA